MKRLVSFLLIPIMMLSLAACGGLDLNPRNTEDDYGAKFGYIGDTMSTEWFDFTVDDAYSCSEYHGYAPSAGYKLVVVIMTLKNNCGQSVDMWGDDFVILWGEDDDTYVDIPLPAGISGDQFPDEYVLGINASRTGIMVYEAPQEFRDFSIGFMELFESSTNPDGEEGDTFFVDFTVEDR